MDLSLRPRWQHGMHGFHARPCRRLPNHPFPARAPITRLLPLLLPVLLTTTSPLAAAPAERFWQRLQVHGFASQAAVQSTENRWFGDSPATSFDFTEIGLNASLRLTPDLLLAGQVLSRRAGATDDGTPALDYGLLDFSLIARPTQRLGVRLGRIKNPLGLYNETRDVPFTRPGIFLPQVVYQDRVRNLILSTDGVMLYGERAEVPGTLSLTLGYGRAVIDQNVEWSFLNFDFPGTLEVAANTRLASLWYTGNNERLRLGLSAAQLGFGFRPNRAAALTLDAGDIDVTLWIASAQYNAERWTLSAEYARQHLEWRGFGPMLGDFAVSPEGFYVQSAYRLRPQLEWMLRAENGVADRDDRSGARFARASGGTAPPQFGFTRALTTGLRWDITPRWMLRAEYSYNDGTYVLSQRENPDLLGQERYWNLFSLLLAVRF